MCTWQPWSMYESDCRDHILLSMPFGCLLCFPVGTTFFIFFILVHMVIGFGVCLQSVCPLKLSLLGRRVEFTASQTVWND